MKNRLFAFLICIMLLLSSCSGDVLDPIITSPVDEFPTSELTEASVPVSLADYKIIRSSTASQSIVSAAVELKKSLSEAVGEIGIADDWARSADDIPAEGLEILVGDTNRKETAALKTELREDGFLPFSHMYLFHAAVDMVITKKM